MKITCKNRKPTIHNTHAFRLKSLRLCRKINQTQSNKWKYCQDAKIGYKKFQSLSRDWIRLHEISHLNLGHFELLGRDEIIEAGDEQSFGLISRASVSKHSPLPELADIDYQLLERCLELQADHEATDIFLKECSLEDVDELRLRIAAMSAMMVLIDIEDSKRNSKQTSHPRAATRIFQILGHVCELPLIELQAEAMQEARAVAPDVIPSEKEQQEFVKRVAIPAFYDAIELAKAADAQHIVEQLGDLPAFFDDVFLAKTNSDKGIEQFKTEGAKEWCQLKPINERVLTVQRERNLI